MQARPSTSRATDVVSAVAFTAARGEATPLSRAIAGVAIMAAAISTAGRSFDLVFQFSPLDMKSQRRWLLFVNGEAIDSSK
jgi:hypothetical protein